MTHKSRLIEHAFPLKQTSLDSVHEKNVRHGHISTLHIWPARRPLAACRAALIATLLADPGTLEERQKLCEKIGGEIVKKIERKKMPNRTTVEREKETTEGGILHWGRETENKEVLDWFRQEILKAYGGRAPKVLDPFAGGGAIPLEAMRLGCEVTAVDINPVAWFILKCTLEYPQKLSGKTHPLPDFILENEDFMNAFYKEHPQVFKKIKISKKKGKQQENKQKDIHWNEHSQENLIPSGTLAWQVRAWGQWVLDHARQDLSKYYPTYDEKTTVAYLWARTVKCKDCRAIIPLLKTRWLCKKKNGQKRVLLTMKPNADKTSVVFGIENHVPLQGGNTAQRREHDKRLGAGTMSKSGATCPCCHTIMTMEDIRLEGQAGRLGTVMTAVVVDGQKGKEYRLPNANEIEMSTVAIDALPKLFDQIPFGLPDEPLPSKEALGFRVPLYGFDNWSKLFTSRQLLALGTFVKWTRKATRIIAESGFPKEWQEALIAYLALAVDRMANRSSTLCIWNMSAEKIEQTFARFALPILWDFTESNPLSTASGNYNGEIEWIFLVCKHLCEAGSYAPTPKIIGQSSTTLEMTGIDVIVTDPPYYDAIPYSDLMDFFYLWLKRNLSALNPEIDRMFHSPLSPKWNHEIKDGELIDDSSRFDGDSGKSKKAYEDGMSKVFQACNKALNSDGKLVIVFAHKHPNAWEALVTAIIRAGFIVDGSWPIQTERTGRMRANASAALASSVWLVCKKRPETARLGWDNKVLEEMRGNIREKLREFWDAGIRGPDFVWSATGPALEAYSKHPVVKKADEKDALLTVSEFLTQVRRMVVDFVVGRVLSGTKTDPTESNEGESSRDRLDEVTAYYLLHRHDFGMDEASAGACILYAVSCGISDKELAGTWNIIGFTKGKSVEEELEAEEESTGEEEANIEIEEDSGSKVKLKTWAQRKGNSMGYNAPHGKSVPLIDRVHRLMHLWKEGELSKVDEYLDNNGLRRQELFKRLLQSLIELAPQGSEERSLLESISNHIQSQGALKDEKQIMLFKNKENEEASHV